MTSSRWFAPAQLDRPLGLQASAHGTAIDGMEDACVGALVLLSNAGVKREYS